MSTEGACLAPAVSPLHFRVSICSRACAVLASPGAGKCLFKRSRSSTAQAQDLPDTAGLLVSSRKYKLERRDRDVLDNRDAARCNVEGKRGKGITENLTIIDFIFRAVDVQTSGCDFDPLPCRIRVVKSRLELESSNFGVSLHQVVGLIEIRVESPWAFGCRCTLGSCRTSI